MPPQSIHLNSRQPKEMGGQSHTSPHPPDSCSSTLEQRLHVAIEAGRLPEVADLVTLGADANSYEDGMTPLARALKFNQREVALFLLHECRPNLYANLIDYKDPPSSEMSSRARRACDHQVPLLLLAVRGNHCDVVRQLLKKGVDPNGAETPSQRSALHLAAQLNLVKIAEVLLEYEANVNKFDVDGNTPLHCAVLHGHRELCRTLLRAGASVNVPEKNGIIPLRMAVKRGDVAMVEDLLDHGGLVHVNNSRGRTLLHTAVLQGSLDLVKVLLARRAYGHAQDLAGGTPLSLACEMRRPDIVEAILKSDNSSLNQLTGHCGGIKVPLHIAAAKGYTEIIDVMLKHGTLVNQRDSTHRYTALLWAIRQCQESVVCSLLQHGANPNMPELVHGLTPLHLACKLDFNGSHLEIVKMLVNHGADISTRIANSRKTALHVVSERAARGIFEFLLKCSGVLLNEHDALGDTPLTLAIKGHHEDIAKGLIKAGCDVSSPCAGNETPLHCCIRNGHYELALELLHHGCDVRVHNDFGESPLSEIVQHIIENDVNSEDNEPLLDLFNSMLFLGAEVGSLSDRKSPLRHLIYRRRPDSITNAAIDAAHRPLHLLQICVLKVRDHLKSLTNGESTSDQMTNLPLPKFLIGQITQNPKFFT